MRVDRANRTEHRRGVEEREKKTLKGSMRKMWMNTVYGCKEDETRRVLPSNVLSLLSRAKPSKGHHLGLTVGQSVHPTLF